MNIHLIRSREVNDKELLEVHDFLLLSNGPLSFIKQNFTITFNEDVVTWDRIFGECIKYRDTYKIPSTDYIVLLMAKPNEQNWFSSYNPNGTREIFVHTADWNYYISCKNTIAIAYQIIENILESLMFDSQEDSYKYCHENAIGCINDMCFWKPDISFKLRTADICSDCIVLLKKKHIEDDIIRQVLDIIDRVRKFALFSHDFYRTGEDSKNLLPFPIAITKRKIETTIEPLRKFLFLLDHFDSLIRTFVLLFGTVALGKNFTNLIKNNNLDGKPSLGDWVRALVNINKYQKEIDVSGDVFQRLNNHQLKAGGLRKRTRSP